MKNKHLTLRKIATVCISISLFLLTLEVAARLDDRLKYGAPFLKLYSPQRLRGIDPDGIKHNVPNSSFEKWHINRFGFRGPDISLQKPTGTIRIACMGTSETFGLHETPGSDWPAQLRDMLSISGHFQVINASVAGLLLKEYVGYIDKYVLKFQPDIILLYINPFGYAIGVDKFDNRQDSLEPQVRTNQTKPKFSFKSISIHLRIVSKIKQAIRNALPPAILRSYRLMNMKKQIKWLESARLNGNNPIDAVSQDSLDRFSTDLEELLEFLNNQHVQVVLTSYPVLISSSNIEEYLEIFLDHRRFYVELSLLGIIDASHKFNEMIRNMALKHNVTFIDNNNKVPKNTRYFADNVHYTDAGATIIAENFANFISTNFVTVKSLDSSVDTM